MHLLSTAELAQARNGRISRRTDDRKLDARVTSGALAGHPGWVAIAESLSLGGFDSAPEPGDKRNWPSRGVFMAVAALSAYWLARAAL